MAKRLRVFGPIFRIGGLLTTSTLVHQVTRLIADTFLPRVPHSNVPAEKLVMSNKDLTSLDLHYRQSHVGPEAGKLVGPQVLFSYSMPYRMRPYGYHLSVDFTEKSRDAKRWGKDGDGAFLSVTNSNSGFCFKFPQFLTLRCTRTDVNTDLPMLIPTTVPAASFKQSPDEMVEFNAKYNPTLPFYVFYDEQGRGFHYIHLASRVLPRLPTNRPCPLIMGVIYAGLIEARGFQNPFHSHWCITPVVLEHVDHLADVRIGAAALPSFHLGGDVFSAFHPYSFLKSVSVNAPTLYHDPTAALVVSGALCAVPTFLEEWVASAQAVKILSSLQYVFRHVGLLVGDFWWATCDVGRVRQAPNYRGTVQNRRKTRRLLVLSSGEKIAPAPMETAICINRCLCAGV
ncbi:hypothetical protein BDN67DRAFT_983444 [Paxillus ammoniavirescens]|nr:hypothetical protein BDN67DRAFT_983444 [Paxillus ammoniavirescens]